MVYDFVCTGATRFGRACGVVEKVSALVHSPPLEGWQAQPDGVVVACLYKHSVGPFPSCGGVAGVA